MLGEYRARETERFEALRRELSIFMDAQREHDAWIGREMEKMGVALTTLRESFDTQWRAYVEREEHNRLVTRVATLETHFLRRESQWSGASLVWVGIAAILGLTATIFAIISAFREVFQ